MYKKIFLNISHADTVSTIVASRRIDYMYFPVSSSLRVRKHKKNVLIVNLKKQFGFQKFMKFLENAIVVKILRV